VVNPWLKSKVKSDTREQQLELILKHPVVCDFSSKHPAIQREVYRSSFGQLNQLVMERENCNHCPGLNQCLNMMPGHYPDLVEYNGYLDLRMMPCHQLKKQEEQKKRKHLIRSHHIPKDIVEASFSSIDPDKGRIDVIEAAIDFCTQFADGKPEKGLYLYGPLGVGKSRIAGAIANELVKYDVDSYMLYVPELMREVNESIQDNSLNKKIEELKTATVLILDDIGAEYLTPWKRDEILGGILQYRSAEQLPTIFTSNLELDELEEHLAQTVKGGADWMKAKRIMERIRHYVRPLFVEGPNRREQR
jgi:primosomal protein DnaI